MKLFGVEYYLPVVMVKCKQCGKDVDKNDFKAVPLLMNFGHGVKYVCDSCYANFIPANSMPVTYAEPK